MTFKICRHILSSGEQCNSPRMRTAEFCYFHQRLHTQHSLATRGRRNTDVYQPVKGDGGAFDGMEPVADADLDFGPLEDRGAVQMAISSVVNALAANRLDLRKATALLYGLQLASSNCSKATRGFSEPSDAVRDVSLSGDGQAMAPEERVPQCVLWSRELVRSMNEEDADKCNCEVCREA